MKLSSKVRRPNKEDKTITFPCLGRGKQSGQIVLFSDFNKGTVLDPQNSEGNEIGTVHTKFTLNDPSLWEILPPGTSVTITVEK